MIFSLNKSAWVLKPFPIQIRAFFIVLSFSLHFLSGISAL